MKKIIIINGAPCSGKDTFANLVGKYAKTVNYSSVDFVKEVAMFAGWDGIKDEKGRSFLSNLKKIMTEYNEIPLKKISEKIKEFRSSDSEIMFVHIREPEEIKKLSDIEKVFTLLVIKDDNEHFNNYADSNVENYEYDYILKNNSTLEDLENKAKGFVKYLRRL